MTGQGLQRQEGNSGPQEPYRGHPSGIKVRTQDGSGIASDWEMRVRHGRQQPVGGMNACTWGKAGPVLDLPTRSKVVSKVLLARGHQPPVLSPPSYTLLLEGSFERHVRI